MEKFANSIDYHSTSSGDYLIVSGEGIKAGLVVPLSGDSGTNSGTIEGPDGVPTRDRTKILLSNPDSGIKFTPLKIDPTKLSPSGTRLSP